MPIDILKFPRGLFGLLGLQAGGVSQKALSDVVVGVVDQTQMYTINDYENLVGAVAAPATGLNLFAVAGVNLIVPPGECWYIHGFTVQGTVPPAGSINLAASVRPGGTAGGGILEQPMQSFVANDVYAIPGNFSGRIIPSGWGFSANIASLVGAVTVNCNLFFTRLKG